MFLYWHLVSALLHILFWAIIGVILLGIINIFKWFFKKIKHAYKIQTDPRYKKRHYQSIYRAHHHEQMKRELKDAEDYRRRNFKSWD